MTLSLNDIAQNPDNFHFSILLKNEELILRPLKPSDIEKLASFLQKLSPETRKFSTFPSYDKTTALELCDAINRYDKLRFVIENNEGELCGLLEFSFDIPQGDLERFEKYGIKLSSKTDCRFGPTLADEYQDKGLGSQILPQLIGLAKQFGRNRIILFGGVLADNQRAIHFYTKNGFQLCGNFFNSEGFKTLDMILEL